MPVDHFFGSTCPTSSRRSSQESDQVQKGAARTRDFGRAGSALRATRPQDRRRGDVHEVAVLRRPLGSVRHCDTPTSTVEAGLLHAERHEMRLLVS